MAALPLRYTARAPASASGGPPPLLLLLHGYGGSEADLMPLAEELDPRLLALSLRAPMTLRPGAYGWCHAIFTPDGPDDDPQEALASRAILWRFLDGLPSAYPFDARRVYLLGFSQGAALALGMALEHPARLAGVAALSGRMMPAFMPPAPSAFSALLPVFLAHGRDDTLVPLRQAREAREVLAAQGMRVTFREYPGGHEIGAECRQEVAAWLRSCLDRV